MRALSGTVGEKAERPADGRPAEGRPAEGRGSRRTDLAERGVWTETAEGISRGTSRWTSRGKFAETGVDSARVGLTEGMIAGGGGYKEDCKKSLCPQSRVSSQANDSIAASCD